MTVSESKMWKYSTVVLALVLLLASGLFLFLPAGPPSQEAGRVVVPIDQDQGELVTELENAVQERNQLKANQAVLSEAKSNLETDLSALRAEVAELKSGLEQGTADLAEGDAKVVALSLERTNLMTQITDLIAARQAVEKRLDEVQQEKNQITALLEQSRGERDTAVAALSQAETQRDRFAGEIEGLRAQVAKFSLESGELKDLAKSEPEEPQSGDPDPQDADVKAVVRLSETPSVLEQSAAEGDDPAKREESPLEKETLLAAIEGDPGDQEIVAVADDEPTALVSGALERGVEQYNQGKYQVAFDTWYPLAEQGVRRAQFYIGSLFHEGRGVAQDPIKAFYWLSLSNKAGYSKAGPVLQTVEEVMTEAQMAAANKLLNTDEN